MRTTLQSIAVAIIALAILVFGIASASGGVEFHAAPVVDAPSAMVQGATPVDPTAEPTDDVTPEPTAEPTNDVTPEPTKSPSERAIEALVAAIVDIIKRVIAAILAGGTPTPVG